MMENGSFGSLSDEEGSARSLGTLSDDEVEEGLADCVTDCSAWRRDVLEEHVVFFGDAEENPSCWAAFLIWGVGKVGELADVEDATNKA